MSASRIQTVLQGNNSLLGSITDPDSRKSYANGFDALLKKLADAAVADGLPHRNVMQLFINHAYEVMSRVPNAGGRDAAQAVLHEAMAIHSMFDDPAKAL